MTLLARREHSRRELARKLEARGFPAAAVADVLDALENAGALSDARFAEDYVRVRIARGFGPLRIGEELRERGVATDIAREAAMASEQEWVARASSACRKRFGDAPVTSLQEKARQIRFLAQRGFTQAQCHRALGATHEDC